MGELKSVESYWQDLTGSREKFRNFILLSIFFWSKEFAFFWRPTWSPIFLDMQTFFVWKVLTHFLTLKTPTGDSRAAHLPDSNQEKECGKNKIKRFSNQKETPQSVNPWKVEATDGQSAKNRDFSKIENTLKIMQVSPQRCWNQAEVLIDSGSLFYFISLGTVPKQRLF
jgi:hypothetical protein